MKTANPWGCVPIAFINSKHPILALVAYLAVPICFLAGIALLSLLEWPHVVAGCAAGAIPALIRRLFR